MTRRSATWLLVFCLLGLGASAASAYVHYRILRDPSYTSFCDVSETVSCQAVYESRFGTVRGVPVALGGVIWFALVSLLVAAGLGGRPPARAPTAAATGHSFAANVPGYLFVLSTAALAVVLYLAYASFVVLKAVCILCVLTYVAVAGIFLVSGTAADFALRSLPRRAIGDARALVTSPVALAVGALFLVGAASAVAFFPRDAGDVQAQAAASPPPPIPQDRQSEFERFFTTAPRVPVMVPSDGAQVVIVKFNDYQCPACGQTYMSYKSVLAKWRAERPGAVKVVVKDYPLEPECNPHVPTVVHQAACEAAAAVRLARVKNRDEAMEEWLYTNQAQLSPASVRQAARDVGQVQDFDGQYARMLDQIKGDVQMARQLAIRVTPTFFINGVRFDGGLRAEYLDAAIAYELKKAAPKP